MFPPEMLLRIFRKGIEGTAPETYHLDKGEKLNEAISRSWNRLRGAWPVFRSAMENNPEGDTGTTPTREKWLLKVFNELGYGRLQSAKPMEIDGKSYPISHTWKNSPIHLVGFRVDLDRSANGIRGVRRRPPSGMVQEFLNRSDTHLWGFLTNGLKLRILRDNASLTRQAFVEFDLEAMMEGEAFADFSLLWLLCHQSRVEADEPAECWLERWTKAAQDEGIRALEYLRVGVEGAITFLGAGFIAHPANQEIRNRLRAGDLQPVEYYRQILRLIYQMIFLFVAEERDLLAPPGTEPAARERYMRHYSMARLRRLAGRLAGNGHDDLCRGLRLVVDKLGENGGCKALGLPVLDSSLFSAKSTPDLRKCLISNHDILDAVRSLAFMSDRHGRHPVRYEGLGSEELGSVYESLLELHPVINVDARTFELKMSGGSERKTTGSYYTPESLISCLLDSALDPVLDEACKQPDPKAVLLNLKVCDPACGSGHFLVAAARRIARRLAVLDAGGEEPSPAEMKRALRRVISSCIYGVDLNPMAVELCKVSLWMEALEPGKPLSFLEHKIRCGNSLLGTFPALCGKGIPDEAYKPLAGDDATHVSSLKQRNRQERLGQGALWFGEGQKSPFADLAPVVQRLNAIADESIQGVHEKEVELARYEESPEFRKACLVADAWCAAFVCKKSGDSPLPMTSDLYRRICDGGEEVPEGVSQKIREMYDEYRFFQWHIAFPDVFTYPAEGQEVENPTAGWCGGFDVVLGNPPWDRIKLQEQEFFSEKRSDIANARSATIRKRMITALAGEDPTLYAAYLNALRKAEGESHIVRDSGAFPLCGCGDVNTYALFAELFLKLLSPKGRAGIVAPTGIATDDSTKAFFNAVVSERRLVSLYDFENREGIFPAVDSRFKFSLLTLGKGAPSADFTFFARNVGQLIDERRRCTLSPEDIALLNPNTKTCPIFRTAYDADLAKKIYHRVPVLIEETKGAVGNPWGIRFLRMFDMANDSGLFMGTAELQKIGAIRDGNSWRTQAGERLVPLYEAKMIQFFDHRFGTYEGRGEDRGYRILPCPSDAQLRNPRYSVEPFYWIPENERDCRVPESWSHEWLFGFKDVTSPTNERTVIFSFMPSCGVGHTLPLCFSPMSTPLIACLAANMNSLVLDYFARQKVGGLHLTYSYLKQLPILPPDTYDEGALNFVVPRVTELTYTAEEMRPFAEDLGYHGIPFPWDPARRAVVRAELDAFFSNLYGLTRDELRYILAPADVYGDDFPSETFRVLKDGEVRKHGEYRTRRLVLEAWDRLRQGELV